MRITALRPYVVSTPWRNLTYLFVDTDEGVSGVGEVRMLNHTDALLGYLQEAAKNHIIGADPFKIEDLVRRMMLNDFARVGQIAMSGISIVEMACWDIVGKALNVPVYQLLGGAVRDRIPAYANGWYTVERQPEQFHAAAQKVVERGYRALKVDPFGAGFYEIGRQEKRRSVALVEAIRDAVGEDTEIFIEMHGRFNPVTAIEITQALLPYRPGWVEEPVPPDNLKALHKVAQAISATGVPVATGERLHTLYEFRELIELQAADILQADLSHFGGLLALKKLAGWADAYFMLIAPHNVCGPVATAANLHVAASTPNFKVQEHFNDFADAWIKQAVTGLPEVDAADGCFSLPTGPGLGVTVDEKFLAEHPRQEVFFNLYQDDWHFRQRGPAATGE
ncbi:MAG: mandelate racemase/muconate lactonizing enzyme family protein [Chloroflexi bacterium]|uniref:mandelate racemase/muconate lactonizing enzyme family protein n=1 Tax=Candidatus Flexifilum breve TaxID=3140694 RepID=UPI003135436D|nr:mandelate racemase/muconate lactonizing enzyme family protein [Chloroflexota bacterium]MBK9745265.1 mandelate racemase/muconate lactonizing enzyme family protein [Chloroflexota bacterium]